ncbi:MAG: helix-turn-helix domain-containing protein [Methanosarcinales archaeon]
MKDYEERNYLSAIEVAKYLGITVKEVHLLIKSNILPATLATSGQYRFKIEDIKKIENLYKKNPLISIP